MTIQSDSLLRRRHAELTRELIMRTVAELLEEGAASELAVPEVARRSGVSLRTVYRYFPTRDELLAATGEWIADQFLEPHLPTRLAEIPENWADNAARFDEHEALFRAMALTAAGQSVRSGRRRQRLEKLQEALSEVTDGLPEAEARRAFAVFAYLNNMLAWVTMRDEAGLDGKEAGAAVVWAMNVLIEDLRRRQRAAGQTKRSRND
jgi:TetR/AcrR family transcriptional regulator, cholesterol catabolism regulator